MQKIRSRMVLWSGIIGATCRDDMTNNDDYSPYDKGLFAVTEGHRLYYERYGTPGAIPVLDVHGGTGARRPAGFARLQARDGPTPGRTRAGQLAHVSAHVRRMGIQPAQ